MATIGAIPSPPPIWYDEIYPCADIVNNTIMLPEEPVNNAVFVFMKGQFMTAGIDYDYVIAGKTITFNGGVLNNYGHVVVKYSFQ